MPTVDKAFAKVTDVTGAAKLALTLEDIAGATYQSAVSAVQAKSSIQVAASIQPVELQHAAILNFVLGQYPVPERLQPPGRRPHARRRVRLTAATGRSCPLTPP